MVCGGGSEKKVVLSFDSNCLLQNWLTTAKPSNRPSTISCILVRRMSPLLSLWPKRACNPMLENHSRCSPRLYLYAFFREMVFRHSVCSWCHYGLVDNYTTCYSVSGAPHRQKWAQRPPTLPDVARRPPKNLPSVISVN